MYQNYIFDLYGTLVDIHTNENKSYLWEKMAEFYGFQGVSYTGKELKAAYLSFCEQENRALREKLLQERSRVSCPEIRIEKVFKDLYERKGMEPAEETVIFTAQMFRILSAKYIRLYDGALEVLQTLKAKGKKVFLLSNAQYVFTMPELHYLGIADCFDGIVISSCESCRKPDITLFEILISRYDLKIIESIMIGNDKVSDIQGAYQAGLDGLYIASNLSPKEDAEMSCPAKYEIADGDLRKILTIESF